MPLPRYSPGKRFEPGNVCLQHFIMFSCYEVDQPKDLRTTVESLILGQKTKKTCIRVEELAILLYYLVLLIASMQLLSTDNHLLLNIGAGSENTYLFAVATVLRHRN
ncbi:hypothetical protein RB195_022213 [Necator americanus]|uniref:Uncharacterized protein n=1 Tax=Necator americanus TaxID=51031 RepID=A0ABR1EED5_NECAM